MQILLVGKNYINKLVLPQNIAGTYWISDKLDNREQKLISIEAKDESWVTNSNQYVKIFELNRIGTTIQWIKTESEVVLKEYYTYGVKLGDSNELYILFCMPVFEKYKHFSIKNTTEITIGTSENNHIVYNNPLVSTINSKLFYDGEKWLLENYNMQFNAFVN